MSPKKKSELYTDEELNAIKEQWLRDKKRIDEELKGFYSQDLDKEYERHLNNRNLQVLFRHAAYLYQGHRGGDTVLYPNEKVLVAEVYWRILKNGYYSRSKIREKKIRAHLGKAVSRQYYRKYGKK